MSEQPSVYDAPFTHMLNSTIDTLSTDPTRSPEEINTQQQAAAMALGALDPEDAVDTLSAARAVASHYAAMECFRRAARPGVSDEMASRLLARAASLSRLTAQTIQALEWRKAMARKSRARASVPDPVAAAAGAQHPMSSENRAAKPAAGQRTQPQAFRERQPASPAPLPFAAPAAGAQYPVPSENRPDPRAAVLPPLPTAASFAEKWPVG
jgi:hypothetical protein